jgi:hypothetical protein
MPLIRQRSCPRPIHGPNHTEPPRRCRANLSHSQPTPLFRRLLPSVGWKARVGRTSRQGHSKTAQRRGPSGPPESRGGPPPPKSFSRPPPLPTRAFHPTLATTLPPSIPPLL